MHFPLSSCANLHPTFSMVHLLHRLYGVDTPVYVCLFDCSLTTRVRMCLAPGRSGDGFRCQNLGGHR